MARKLGELYGEQFAIVSGKSNPPLVSGVAEHLGVKPIFLQTENWGNGYPRCVRPKEVTFAEKKVIIITSLQYREIGSPVEELELMVDACGSSSDIHLILTWFCGKDDVSHSPGHVPTTAWLASRIKHLPNLKSVNVFDPHQSSHLEFFHPLRRRRFYFLRLLIEKARELGIEQIAATDFSSTKRASRVEEILQTGHPIFLASKDHSHAGKDSPLSKLGLTGDLVGRKIAIFDDMALSWKTMKAVVENLHPLIEAAEKEGRGKADVYAFAAHFDPTAETHDNLKEALTNGWLKSFITTNSKLLDPKFLELPGFAFVDVSEMVAELVEALVLGSSTSDMFKDI